MNKLERIHNKLVQDFQKGKRIPTLKLVRAKCLECLGYVYTEIELCSDPNCPLFPLRYGVNRTGKKYYKNLKIDLKKNGLEDD